VRVFLAQAAAQSLSVDALAVPIAGGERLQGGAMELDTALGGLITDVVRSGEHRGRHNETLPLPTGGRIAARRVLLYGLGSVADLDGQRLRYAHHEMVRAARGYGYGRLAVLRSEPLEPEHLSGVVEGCVMGSWERRSRQTGSRVAELEELQLIGFGEGRERELAAAQQLGEATNRAREWQNQPANELTPEGLAGIARDIGARHQLEVEVLGPSELRSGGYNLLLGVAAGSAQAPCLIRIEHRGASAPGGTPQRKLALVGKGITFDSGGLSIKADRQMVNMKGDMGGAAAVLAAIEVIAARSVPLDVMAVVAATENMINGHAQKPGDVVKSASGKTVEVVNTDAEGRLVLADALTFAIRRGATHLVDLATLTGSATVAVGHAASVALANDDGLWALAARAAEQAGDRVWRLPIYPDYRVLLRSRVADLRNGYYGEAGAICAGMFIEQFVESRPWVHLDIAGSSWNDNDDLVSVPRGPLGSGSRLIVHLAEILAREPPILAGSQ
jgi:leucyl aminopeptidase